MTARYKLLVALLAASAGIADAATTTANLSVTATVSASCLVTTGAVAFGAYTASSGSPTDATGAVNVTCTTGTTYSIALDAGTYPSSPGDASARRMSDGSSHYLAYSLYLDSGRTTLWGDGSNGTSVNPTSGSFTGDGSAQGRTVYGRVPANQYVTPGAYSDTVTATVTYN